MRKNRKGILAMGFLRLFLIVNIVICLVISLVFADSVLPTDSTKFTPPNLQNPSNLSTGVIWTGQLTASGSATNTSGPTQQSPLPSNTATTNVVCPPNTCAQLVCPNTQISQPAISVYCNLYNYILTPKLAVTTSQNQVTNYTVSFTVVIATQGSFRGSDSRHDCLQSPYYFSAQCYVLCQTYPPNEATSQQQCPSYGLYNSK